MGTIQQPYLQMFKGLRTNPRRVPPFPLQTKKTTKTQEKDSNTFEKQLKTLKNKTPHKSTQNPSTIYTYIYMYMYIYIYQCIQIQGECFSRCFLFFVVCFTSSFHGLETFQGPWLWYSRWVPLRPGKDPSPSPSFRSHDGFPMGRFTVYRRIYPI